MGKSQIYKKGGMSDNRRIKVKESNDQRVESKVSKGEIIKYWTLIKRQKVIVMFQFTRGSHRDVSTLVK